MSAVKRRGFRDVFALYNARNMRVEEVVRTYVPSEDLWRALSAKNQIILGARGSGKTTLVKMLSHEHLSKLDHPRAKELVDDCAFIGLYVPTGLEWVSSLRNKPWLNERELEAHFSWKLNLASCLALATTLVSCLDSYVRDPLARAKAEVGLCNALSRLWMGTDARNLGEAPTTLHQLQERLSELNYRKSTELAVRQFGQCLDRTLIGPELHAELFAPLRASIEAATSIIQLPENAVWLLCIDEAEFLTVEHHRILNTHLRAASGRLFFKVTTTPYHHHTLETNTGAPLSPDNDFDYLYIDHDPISRGRPDSHVAIENFASTVFSSRIASAPSNEGHPSLRELLGESIMFRESMDVWEPGDEMWVLLGRYADERTKARAERLATSPAAFRDQVARKIRPALLARKAADASGVRKRRNEIYSGVEMFLRCSDYNPRRMIRLFSDVVSRLHSLKRLPSRSVPLLPRAMQADALFEFSRRALEKSQSMIGQGDRLFKLLTHIGEYLRARLYFEEVTTDQYAGIFASSGESPSEWMLLTHAVQEALLYPVWTGGQWVPGTNATVNFRFAYVLAPYFQLIPRRGRYASLQSVLGRRRRGTEEGSDREHPSSGERQGGLYGEGVDSWS